MDSVIPEMRRTAKIVNFGLIYGAGPFRMSQELGIPQKEAKTIIEAYFEKYSGIENYIQSTVEKARELQYVETILGRRRPVWDIDSSNHLHREAAKRMAINMPIQGTNAEMIKLAMIEIQKKMDSKKMFKVYDMWPDIAKESYEQEFSKHEFKDIDHIVFAGMGGSGTIGDVFSSILSKNDIHTSVVKGYLLPKTVDENTLVVVTSVSGNTQEPLTILKNSKNSKAKFIVFSSGGMIKEYALKNKINYQEIKMEHSPRASFSKYIFSMLKSLESVIPVKKSDVLDTVSKMEIMQKNISSNNLSENNNALNIAEWITGTPVIYYPWGLQSAAIRFKNSLQENSNLHVITEDVIEACHNGIVSWERNSNMQPILIQGHDDYFKTKERWDILKEFFNSKQIQYKEIHSLSGSIISKIINLIYLFDYASIYYSVISGIDPSPVSAIDFIKERLSK